MITEIRLNNFKAFERQKFTIRPLTLLTGLNGTGKSTVIQSIGLLYQSYKTDLLRKQKWLLNGDYVEIGTGHDLLYEGAETEIIEISFKEAIRNQKEREHSYQVRYESENDILEFGDSDMTKRDMRPALIFRRPLQYLRADRIVPATTYPKSFHVVHEQQFLGTRGQFVPHYLSVFGDTQVRKARRHPMEKKSRLLDQLSAWMKLISPGVIVQTHDVEKTEFVRLAFGFPAGGGVGGVEAYRPTNVGFGLTYTLPVVAACLGAEPGSTLMIENPEAHLHPAGQMAIARLISAAVSDGVQVLLETHSDHVLNGVRISVKNTLLSSSQVATLFFSKPKYAQSGEVQLIEILENGMLSEWPAGFFDQLDDSLDQLLE